ncbi:hypothetical protein GALL_287540 [mine drainage metagenome]|uniref:Uncharacterized protein n=1 Tax=mine drainage metagenome TaxID=410659 RepID=A0A1J5R1N9_9ZZZZ
MNLKFLYGEAAAEAPAAAVAPAALAALPQALRTALRDAVESLDSEAITAAIARIGAHDPAQAQALARLAGEFDYPAILAALQTVAG